MEANYYSHIIEYEWIKEMNESAPSNRALFYLQYKNRGLQGEQGHDGLFGLIQVLRIENSMNHLPTRSASVARRVNAPPVEGSKTQASVTDPLSEHPHLHTHTGTHTDRHTLELLTYV